MSASALRRLDYPSRSARRSARPGADGVEAAVDREHDAGHPARLVAGQVERAVGHVPSGAFGLQGDGLAPAFTGLLPHPRDQRREDGADDEGVGADALRLVASTRMTTDLTGERGIVGWANLTAEQYDDIDAFYNRTRDACEQRFDSPEDVIADVVHNCTFMVMARITHFATPHWILGVVDYVRNSLALVRNRLVFNLVSLIIDPLVFLFGMLAPCYILVVNVMISSSLVLPRVNKNAIRLAWFLLAALAVRRDRRHLLWTAFIFLSLLDTLQLKAERRLGYCLFQ